jgi:hypothetical protein
MTGTGRTQGISRRMALLAAVAAAAVALGVAGGASAVAGAAQSHEHASVAASRLSPRALHFHDRMRKLWEDHITWTRLAIVSFAGNLPDFDVTAARLMRNQTDIGNAIKPYYGAAAGNRLTALLKEHIAGAVAILQAAKAQDTAAFASAKTSWYANAQDISRFLHSANPRHWRLSDVNELMRIHLDQTLKEASDRLGGQFNASVRDYDAIHSHILVMADALSSGIIAQFPARFR